MSPSTLAPLTGASRPHAAPPDALDSSKRPRVDLADVVPAPAIEPPMQKSTSQAETTFQCAICMGPMVDPAVGGGCAHHFCHECYESWETLTD